MAQVVPERHPVKSWGAVNRLADGRLYEISVLALKFRWALPIS